MQRIASRLKQLREKEEMSQEQVAEALHIHPSTYKGYETAYRRIPVDVLRDAAEYYDVTLDYIFGLTNIPYALDKRENEIARKYYALKKEDQFRIQERITTLYEIEHPLKTLKDKKKEK